MTWLSDIPESVINDMRLLQAQREDAAELLSRADALRSELNREISAANAREELLNGRESALRKREAAIAEAEARLHKFFEEMGV